MNIIRSIKHRLWWMAPWRFKMGFRNLWRFRKAVWHFHACDWTGLIGVMEVAFTEMRNGHKNFAMTADAQKISRELTIAKELCKRLAREDNDDETMQRDVNYLCDLIRKVRCWWY